MENSSKQSEMSHNLVRWKLRESSAVWRSIHTGWNGQCYTSRVVTGPECTDADCRWAREREVRFWVFRNASSSMSLQTRTCSHIIQNLPCGVTENSSEAFRAHSPWFVAGFRAESSPSSSTRAHTQTHGRTRAHTHMWGEGMGTVRNLTIPFP